MLQLNLPLMCADASGTFSRAEAVVAATRLKPALERHAYRLPHPDGGVEKLFRIAGSLRRGRRAVRDVDVVAAVSTAPEDMLHPEENPRSRLRRAVSQMCDEVVAWGPDHARFVLNGVPFDLYFTKSRTFTVGLVLATGSERFIGEVTRQAASLGMRFHWGQHALLGPDGSPLRLRSEEEVFRALRLPFLRPEERD